MRNLSGRDDQLHDARQITSRMDEVQAAILRVKLTRLDNWLDERHELATLYMQYLPKQVRCVSRRREISTTCSSIRTERRDQLRTYLASHGVETKVHFPSHCTCNPLHGPRTTLDCLALRLGASQC